MTDGFTIWPGEVQALADTFQEQQGVPNEVAQAIQGASSIDTGDPSLDAETRELAAEIGRVLQAMAKILSGASDGLNQVTQDFMDTDDTVASRLDQIQFDNLASEDGEASTPTPGSTPTPSPSPGGDSTPVASLPSIAEQLAPTA
jgi:hypothetical protein